MNKHAARVKHLFVPKDGEPWPPRWILMLCLLAVAVGTFWNAALLVKAEARATLQSQVAAQQTEQKQDLIDVGKEACDANAPVTPEGSRLCAEVQAADESPKPSPEGASALDTLRGKDGRDGADGYPGPMGPAGPAGKDGKPGKDGQDGAAVDGQDGASVAGPPGADGAPGATGPEGPQGPAGAPGEPGADGRDGAPPSMIKVRNADGSTQTCTPDEPGGTVYTCTYDNPPPTTPLG